ncbi:T9SS type A sorting domain-containing protein [Flavobacterium sp. NRK F10]|uniref:T9SS type A sorting domain-containing protein n=1 Tax=Flavobacterium sp. NRK F10 TaxID=2954931 RepID=UPI0020915250|nr:T9SS type A sorting domain-containing protein [Flavobacterium sp. NRK F10]MCO6175015.1 T9SS type A sorting domain-containing protein [Flavobacterium sp. NRK F10]
MKKLYLLSILFISTLSFGQATELYFSMYGEGSSSNKFLEIYNGTGSNVDLGDYSVELYSNGASTATNTQTFTAGTILNAGDVYVLYNSSSNATIVSAGDASSSTCNFNGDDAVALLKLGSVIDVIGEIGVDPGSSWNVGSTTGGTVNHTLVRKSSICSPNATPLGSFGTDDATSEWDVFASDAEWGQIGTHNGCSTSPSLVISSPTDGTIYSPLTTSVDVTLSISNFVVANGTGDGHIHYTINGGSTIMKYDTTPINVTVSTGNSYTVYVELVDNSHTPISPAVNATVTFSVASFIAVTDLAAMRADVIANGVGSYYQISSNPVISYSRSSRNQKYIQDTSAGVLIDDNDGIMPYNDGTGSGPVQGDALSGLQGYTVDYNGVLEFIPIATATVASSGNSITPQVVTASDITSNIEAYESELVQINSATFADGDGTATFASGANYIANDGTDITFRTIFSEANYIGTVIPTTPQTLVVLVAEYNGTAQVVARDLADMPLETRSFDAVDGLTMYPNPVSGGTLYINTSANTSKQVQVYDVLGKQVINATVSNNTLNVANLNSGIYIVKITEEGKTATRKLIVR